MVLWGNAYMDAIETLGQKRALEVYKLDPNKWVVNIQLYSGWSKYVYVCYLCTCHFMS